jgi:hypothetical protein
VNAIDVVLECDPDEHDPATPRRLRFGRRVIEVAETLDRWPGADHCYVKIRGGDGNLYVVRQGIANGRWELVLYVGGGAEREAHPRNGGHRHQLQH